MSRTITFCGNGALDLIEECDGSTSCTSQCKCQIGTVGLRGTCTDQCNNGIVTGTEECDSGLNCVECKCAPGYQPMSPRGQGCQLIPADFVPNVEPTLDCLDIKSFGLVLYFSFNNKDGYNQTIPHGPFNTFLPTGLSQGTPTFFTAGQSLTYPAWFYAATVSNDTQSITWILGSYNLTVDLSNPTLLECPRNPSIDLTMSTFGNLTDALVRQLLQNIADKYNISASRLSAEYKLKSTDSQGVNTYVIVITINTSTIETSSIDVVKELLNDIQTQKEDLVSDLTEGLEEINPVIKTVTPSVIKNRGTTDPPSSVFTPIQSSESTAIRSGMQFVVYYLIVALIMTI